MPRRLVAGRRYGLVGRNGVGKSSLLRAMGWDLLLGFPRHVRCLYVSQVGGWVGRGGRGGRWSG